MVKEHSQLVVAFMGLLDLAVTAAAWLVCFYVRFHTGWFAMAESEPPGLWYVRDPLIITLLLVLLLFPRMGLYRARRAGSFRTEAFDILRACLVVWLSAFVLSNLLRGWGVSRLLLLQFLAVWAVLLVTYRGAARAFLRRVRRRGRNLRTVAIVGDGRAAQTLFHVLGRQRWTGYAVQYFVADRPGRRLCGLPVRGPLERVGAILEAEPVDAAFVALPKDAASRLPEVLDKLSGRLVDVSVVPDLLGHAFLRHEVRQIGPLPVVSLTHSPQSGWNAAMKRIFDVVAAAVALVVLAPLLLLIAVAVKFSSGGPVLYAQRRASLGGRPFRILKFRTMRDGRAGEEIDEEAWSTDPADPRITPLGRVLRRLNLDELPQLLNVLRGDMSLVGPRPERPGFVRRFTRQVPRYVLRHHVKAGITGWAQVNGYRGRTSLTKRIQYDLDYIGRWSFGFDLWILLRTLLAPLTPTPRRQSAGSPENDND